jgi:tRNA pseudouridine55 synthase
MQSGIFLVNKDKGISSNKAIQKLKKKLDIHKIGHFGTLDPNASGLLVCAINKATKLSDKFLNSDKGYIAEVTLGISTSTDDSEGEIIFQSEVETSIDQIESSLKQFRGKSMQIPPFFSALKHKGKPLYKYARDGEFITKPAREIIVHEIKDFKACLPTITFKIFCSKGTYIRSIARDLGESLGCGGHLSGLKRVLQGPFSLKNASTLDDLNWNHLIHLEEIQQFY